MVTPTSVCRTVTLTDEPEEKDAFSGPHQRIVDAIAGLIQPSDAKGISIGVEGSWGSGKSTVARLLTKQLEGDKNIATVYFDAWAHEGDPLRRTFLEAIIRKLQASDWITKPDWDECIEDLANRREVVKTKDSLSITRSGRLLAFSLLLIPIGGAFITGALRESNVTLYPGPPAWRFLILLFIGLLLTFTPFIVLLLKIKEEADLLSLLFNKGPTEKTTVTSRTINPTSIEFEEYFNKLLEAALGNNEKRLVLILDNLDRVDAKDALSIWSTLQTFLQHKGMAPRPWHKRLWLLVLYDIRGLSQLWENSENARGKTALSFIDKSFQVRFEVPALVSSDWRQFLMDQLKHAFEDHSDSDRHDVYRVLATHVALNNKVLTIREMKLFINQIGAIHKQWAAGGDRVADAFPLALIAYYVLIRRDSADVVTSLFDPEFPSTAYQELLGDMARENLAAIAFNVEVDVAQQLLFSDKIKSALTLGSPDELKKVASLLRRGFWEVFEQTAKDWAKTETVKVAEAALALEESGLLSNAFRPSVIAVMKAFCDRAGAVETWAPLDRKKATGILVILRWKNDLGGTSDYKEAFTHRLFKAIALGLGEHAKDSNEREGAETWLECLTLVLEGQESSTKQNALNTVVYTLAHQFGAGGFDSFKLELCLEVLLELERNIAIGATVDKNLRALADDGNIHRALVATRNQNSRADAFMTYVLIRYSSAFQGIPTFSTDPENKTNELRTLFNDAMVQSFVGLLERHKQFPLLFSALKTAPEIEPLVVASLKLILKAPDAKDLFPGPDALERLEFVFAHLPTNSEEVPVVTRLISELQEQWDLLGTLRAGSFSSTNARLYLLALKESTGDQKAFISWCVAGLRSIDTVTWRREFVKGGPLFSLAFELRSRGIELELGENYRLFVKEMVRWQSDTKKYPFPAENVAALAGPLGSESRSLIQQDLEERLKDPSAVLTKWFFIAFGFELKVMLEQSACHLDLLEVIVTRTDFRGLEILLSLFIQIGPELQAKYSSEPAWSRLKGALRRALTIKTVDDETRKLIKSIARSLSVSLPLNRDVAFAVYGEARICSLELKTLETRVLVEDSSSGDYVFTEPSWAPDGKRLAYTRSLKAGLVYSEIFLLDTASGSHIPITSTDQSSSQPSWSPDGRMLAFVKQEGTKHDIYTIDVLTREECRVTEDGLRKAGPKWSPEGGKLVFGRVDSDPLGRICIIYADGSNEVQIYEGTGSLDPSWSPDGQQIVFARSLTDERSGIYLINISGSDWTQLISQPEPRLPVWSPDGQKLLFQAGVNNQARIYQVDADGMNKKLLIGGIDPTWQPLLPDAPDETESPSDPPRS